MKKDETGLPLHEALYPRQVLATKILPVPPLMRAADLLGANDQQLAAGCSLMGNPPSYVKQTRVFPSHLNDHRHGKRKLPLFTRGKIVAYLEFAASELKRLYRLASVADLHPKLADVAEAEKILAEEMQNPDVAEMVRHYRKGFDAVFRGTADGRRFLQSQEKQLLELAGKKH